MITKLNQTVATIITTGGYIWLAQRSQTCRTFKGFWQAPGGEVEDDESIFTAVKRELYEETRIVWQKDIRNYQWIDRVPDATCECCTLYLAETMREPIVREPDKIKGKWELFSIPEVMCLPRVMPGIKNILAQHEELICLKY